MESLWDPTCRREGASCLRTIRSLNTTFYIFNAAVSPVHTQRFFTFNAPFCPSCIAWEYANKAAKQIQVRGGDMRKRRKTRTGQQTKERIPLRKFFRAMVRLNTCSRSCPKYESAWEKAGHVSLQKSLGTHKRKHTKARSNNGHSYNWEADKRAIL